MQPALLILEDGTFFRGHSIGAAGMRVGEVVFNTAITGYQEILTDPSYAEQLVTLTYPHVGNTGTNIEDNEASKIFSQGLIIRALPKCYSNWRADSSLQRFLEQRDVVAISDIDTRQLTNLLRKQGAQRGALVAGDKIDQDQALAAARAFPGIGGMDLAQLVSTATPYSWNEGEWRLGVGYHPLQRKYSSNSPCTRINWLAVA